MSPRRTSPLVEGLLHAYRGLSLRDRLDFLSGVRAAADGDAERIRSTRDSGSAPAGAARAVAGLPVSDPVDPAPRVPREATP